MKILFIASGSIGDAIISTGILGYLMDTYPEARFTIAGGPAAVTLFEAFPKLDRLIRIKKLPRNRHWLVLWQEVCGEKWDIVVDLRGSLLSFFLRTRKRFIFYKPDRNLSKSQQLAALFRLDTPPPTRLWAGAQAKENALRLLPQGKDIIVLAPKTASAAKDWAIENFAELARRLYRNNTVFAVLATAAQQASVQPLVQAIPREHILDLSGQTDLLTAYAILERSTLFIGNDSGLFHMAAAAGIRCVGLYGPSNDKIYAPRGPHVRIVNAHDFKMNEKEKKDNKYMQMITVDRVEEATIF